MYLFFPTLSIFILERHNIIVLKFYFCKAIDVMNILGTLAVILFSFFFKKKKATVCKQAEISMQSKCLSHNRTALKTVRASLLSPLQTPAERTCSVMCNVLSVQCLHTGCQHKRCASLNVSHQQHDKPRHLLCLPWDPHLSITFLEWKLFGAGTVSQPELRALLALIEHNQFAGFFLSKDQRMN